MPHLRQSPDPNVVMITSIAGLRPAGSSIAYAMSKAALNHLVALLAKSCGPVRVNAVAPGLVATPWTADWAEQHAAVADAVPLHRSATSGGLRRGRRLVAPQLATSRVTSWSSTEEPRS